MKFIYYFTAILNFFANCNIIQIDAIDLEDTQSGVTDDDFEHIGKLLPRLKFLSLRGCKGITHLPDSVGGLRQLETLDVKHTKIVTMPRAIIKLVKLQYVHADPVISDEGDDAASPAQDEDDCESTSSEDSWESREDDMVPRNGAPLGDSDSVITSQPPAVPSAQGDDTSTRKGEARNDRMMVLRWAGWCWTKVLMLVGLMLHTLSFGQRCWAGATAQVTADLAEHLSTTQSGETSSDGTSQAVATIAEGDVRSTNQSAAEDDGTSTSNAVADGDDTRTSQQAAEVDGDDTSQLPAAIDGDRS